MEIGIPFFEIVGLLVVASILKWIPLLVIIAIVIKVIAGVKENINNKLDQFEQTIKDGREER